MISFLTASFFLGFINQSHGINWQFLQIILLKLQVWNSVNWQNTCTFVV